MPRSPGNRLVTWLFRHHACRLPIRPLTGRHEGATTHRATALSFIWGAMFDGRILIQIVYESLSTASLSGRLEMIASISCAFCIARPARRVTGPSWGHHRAITGPVTRHGPGTGPSRARHRHGLAWAQTHMSLCRLAWQLSVLAECACPRNPCGTHNVDRTVRCCTGASRGKLLRGHVWIRTHATVAPAGQLHQRQPLVHHPLKERSPCLAPALELMPSTRPHARTLESVQKRHLASPALNARQCWCKQKRHAPLLGPGAACQHGQRLVCLNRSLLGTQGIPLRRVLDIKKRRCLLLACSS